MIEDAGKEPPAIGVRRMGRFVEVGIGTEEGGMHVAGLTPAMAVDVAEALLAAAGEITGLVYSFEAPGHRWSNIPSGEGEADGGD